MNQFQVNTVAATYFLVTFLTDVPTGAFADAIGRRVSVVLGCALHAAAFMLYFYSYHYWHFILAEITDGVATTFGNGAIDAWAVDALDAAGFEGAKDKIFSRVAQIFRIGAMPGALIGAYSARVGLAIPFLLGAVGWIVVGAVGFILMDRPTRTVKQFSMSAGTATADDRWHSGRLLDPSGISAGLCLTDFGGGVVSILAGVATILSRPDGFGSRSHRMDFLLVQPGANCGCRTGCATTLGA